MSANPSFDQIASTTFKNLEKNIADNVSNHIPLFKFMRTKGATVVSGGDTIQRPLLEAFSNAQSYSGSDTLDITHNDDITSAEYNWKQTAAVINIQGIEKARNSGPEKQISLLEGLREQAEVSLANKVSTMMFGDGTGNDSKDMLGLQAIVDVAPTTGTLGGINRATNSFWRNKVDASVGAQSTELISSMSTMKRSLTRGVDMPNIIVTDTTNFGYLQNLSFGNQRFTKSDLADIGFVALKFEGIDVIFDDNCPAGKMYFLNTRWLKLYIHRDYNFKMGKFIEPADADISVAKLLFYAQLTTNRAEACGVLDGITSS
jgi:hypothetical protein